MRISTWLSIRRLLLPVWTTLFISLLTTSVINKAWAQASSFTAAKVEDGTDCNWPFSAMATNPVDGKIYALWRKGADVNVTYKLIRWDGSSWTTLSTFTTANGTSSSIKVPDFSGGSDYVSLAIDATGRFHVAFKGGSASVGREAIWYGLSPTGTTWSFQSLQALPANSINQSLLDQVIEVDPQNQPHVAFLYTTAEAPRSYTLRYFRLVGGSWVGETAITQSGSSNGGTVSNEIARFDLAIDKNAKAHLSFRRELNGTGRDGSLFYMNNTSGSWSTPQELVAGNTAQAQGVTNTIDTDAANNVHIVHSDYQHKLYYTTNESGSFVTNQINGNVTGDVYSKHTLRINGKGDKFVVYNDNISSPTKLNYAYQLAGTSGSTWTTGTAYTPTEAGNGGNYYSGLMSDDRRIMVLFDNSLTSTRGQCSEFRRDLWYATATVKAPPQVAPTVTSSAASAITASSAILGGSVTADGGASISGRGVVYSTTNATPTVGGGGVTQDVNGSVTATFSKTVSGLMPNMTYYVRAYATNSVGTSYGSTQTFTTSMLVTTAPVLTTPVNGVTTNAMPAFMGTAPAGSTVTIYLNGNAIGTTTATQGGGFSRAAGTALTDGTYSVYTTAQLSGHTVSANSNINTFTVDATAPAVSSLVRNNPTGATTNGTQVTYGVNFSEDVSGVAIGSFALTTNGSVSGTIAGVQRVNNTSNSQYLVFVNEVSGNGTLRLDVKGSGSGISDGVGNALSGGFTGGQTFTIDQTAPTVTINSPVGASGAATRLSPIPFTVNFSESVNGFTANRVTVSNGTLSGFTGSGSGPYRFNVMPSDNGLVTVKVGANGSQDEAGNGNTAANPFSIDYQPLTITGVAATNPVCAGSPLLFTATVSNATGPYAYTLTNGSQVVMDSFTGTAFSYTLTAAGSGLQSITLRVTDASQTAQASQSVTVNTLPVPTITGLASAYCKDAPAVSLAGLGSPTGGSFIIDGNTANEFTPMSLSVGNRSVVYRFTDGNGCTNTATQTVTVKEVPPTPILLTQSGGTYPAGVSSLTISQNVGNVILTASGCAGGVITWAGGNSTTLAVSTGNLGTQTFAAICTINGCASPAATATVTVVPATLGVLYRDADFGNTTNNIIKPYFQLSNAGNQAIPYGEVTVRYWFTPEGNAPPTNLAVYYAQPGAVSMKYVALAQPRQGALGYIEYSFPGGGSLGAVGNSGPVENGIQKTDGSGFDELDDYSYQANYANYQPNARMTAYRNGVIFWGQEPTTVPSQTAVAIYSAAKDGPTTSQIQTRLELRNTGNVALPVANLKLRYYFSSDNNQPANVYVDYADMGASKVAARVVKLPAPVEGADSYVELSFPNNTMLINALSSLGVIDFRLVRSDNGLFNQSNDYSYAANYGNVGLNNRVTVLLDNRLIFGTPPAGAPARLGATEPVAVLGVQVLGNPVVGEQAQLKITGVAGQAVSLRLVDLQGRTIHEQRIEQAGETESVSVPLGQSRGQLLLRVSTASQQQSLKLMRP